MTTEIEWGDIALTGPQMKALREAGLLGDVPVTKLKWTNMHSAEDMDFYENDPVYRLPAHDPSYLCHVHNEANGTSFKPWYGGDEPPGDYDATKPFLFRDGEAADFDATYFRWSSTGDVGDIIGYHALPKQEEVEGEVPEWAQREFCERANLNYREVLHGSDAVALRSAMRAGGKLISQHEQPVDMDIYEARRMASARCPSSASSYNLGRLDKTYLVQDLLQGIKKGRELSEAGK